MRNIACLLAAGLILAGFTPRPDDAPMPQEIMLVLCKMRVSDEPPDQNAKWTGHVKLEHVTEGNKLVCRRKEVQLEDSAVMVSLGTGQPAKPQPFTPQRCMRALAGFLGFHIGSYYVERAACPTPVADSTGRIVKWELPDCGKRDVMICENDTVI